MNRRRALTTIGWSSLAVPLLAGCVRKEDPPKDADPDPEPEEDDGLADFLFVQEAEGVRFEGDRLTLVNVNPRTLYFSDRPDEIAGYFSFTEFIDFVGKGPDNFEEDPPNATLVIMEGDTLANVVVELSEKPALQGEDLVFSSVRIIQGDPPDRGGTAALFIDTIGRPMSPGSVAGVHRRHRRRRAAHR